MAVSFALTRNAIEVVFEQMRKCVRSKKTNEDALPDDLKKKSILCSVGTTDIKTITFGSTEPALQPGKYSYADCTEIPPKLVEIGD